VLGFPLAPDIGQIRGLARRGPNQHGLGFGGIAHSWEVAKKLIDVEFFTEGPASSSRIPGPSISPRKFFSASMRSRSSSSESCSCAASGRAAILVIANFQCPAHTRNYTTFIRCPAHVGGVWAHWTASAAHTNPFWHRTCHAREAGMQHDFDMIVIGSGPSGRRAAVQSGEAWETVLVVEKGRRVRRRCRCHTGRSRRRPCARRCSICLAGAEPVFMGRSYRGQARHRRRRSDGAAAQDTRP